MLKNNFVDIFSFMIVAKEQSFTKAAAKLGVSQSALSHSIRLLEDRLQVRLLTRTTRSVAATEAGKRFLAQFEPLCAEMENQLTRLTESRTEPNGTIRLSAGEHATDWVLWPLLKPFLKQYPDITLEINVDNTLLDIVGEGYDAGIRMGEHLAKDMIATRIADDMRIAVVGSPEYFSKFERPQTPQDLMQHRCINMRLPTHHSVAIWEFTEPTFIQSSINNMQIDSSNTQTSQIVQSNKSIKVKTDGKLIFNTLRQRIDAALNGFGLAYVPEDTVQELIQNGELIRVLDDWCVPFSGYHLYYTSRKQHTVAFSLLLDFLRSNSAVKHNTIKQNTIKHNTIKQ